MADLFAECNSNLSCKISIRAVSAYCEVVGRTADSAVRCGTLSVHYREHSNSGFEISSSNFTCVPRTILIESSLSSKEVSLYFVIAERYAGWIEVSLVDHFLHYVNRLSDIRIIPCCLACEDLSEVLITDRLEDDWLEVLSYAPCLTSGTSEWDDACSNQVVAALCKLFISLRNFVPASLLQQIHVSVHSYDVECCRNAVVLAVIS